MKETQADTRTALLQALGLHVVLFALMFAGLNWTRSNVAEAAQGEVIEADLVDPSALSASMRSALLRAPEPPPEPVVEQPVVEQPVVEPEPPLPEPIAEEAPPVPEPEPVEQEKVQRDADSPEVAKVPREQEAKRKQPQQVDLDAEKRRQAELAKVRKQLADARRERTQAEMRDQQLADARNAAVAAAQADARASTPPPGNRGTDPGLLAQYAAALQQAIVRQWIRPESVQLGQRCRLSIRQLKGGEVVDVTFAPSCPFDEQGRQSVERAVMKASPLPYEGFETVFNRNLDLNFVAEER